ncbi:MAG: HelD family protein [Pseudonocardia sp.]
MAGTSTRQDEIAAEQRHVDRVYGRVAELRAEAKDMRAAGYRRGQERHPGALFERDVMVFQASRMLRELETEHEGLVFGRLDRVGGKVDYIGRLGVRDEDYEPLVIDWRAPVAAPFYRATAEDPMDVVRRRNIRCFAGQVTAVDDDLLMPEAAPSNLPVVGEGSLMADLARARGPQMRDIVATIQREQDQAVRAPSSGITEITGGPGTGKTAVALHRAAYLLYRDRRRFSGGVLVVGPSPVFMNYISRVLPALGEDTVELQALGELVPGVTASRLDPASVAAVKGSARIRRVLRAAARDTPPGAPTQLRMVYRGQVLRLDASALAEARKRVYRGRVLPNNARREAAAELLEQLWRTAWRYAQDDWDNAAVEVAPDRATLVADLGDRSELEDFLVAWWPIRTPTEVLAGLADHARLAAAARGVLTAAEVDALAASWADVGDLEAGWSVADVALLDELRVLLGEPGAPREREYFYGHLIVDEAQDLSPMQWRMLGRRGRYASWTIVGDPVQSSWPDAGEANTARDAALGRVKARRRFVLRTNYRNSKEIFELAASVIGTDADPADLPTAVRSTGQLPVQRRVTAEELPEVVRTSALKLLGEVDGTVGVIAAMDRRGEVAGWLAGEVADPRLRVLGSLEAKGLEYDAVVLVEPTELMAESATGRRALYVALTRATQQLTVVHTTADWSSPPEG